MDNFTADNHSALLWTVIGICILIIHFLPSYIAFSKDMANKVLILIINILMGWTVIGWIVLMVWVTKKE